MIATWTRLELEPSALLGTRASSIQVVSSPLLWQSSGAVTTGTDDVRSLPRGVSDGSPLAGCSRLQ